MSEKWPEEELGKHAYIKGRIGWRGLKASEYKSDGPFLIAGNHIKNGQVEWSDCDHINMSRYNESWEIALKEKDIILTKDGTIGRVAIIKSLPGPATINSTMMLVRVSPPLTAEFIYHYLNSDSFQKLVEDRVSGSSIPHIFQQDMKKLKTPVPSKFEQLRIAQILDTIDEAIQRTEQLIAKLKALKQGLLHDLLTRGLDENGQFRNPISHPEQFKDSPLERIPKEWDVFSIQDFAAVKGGKRLPKGHFYSETSTTFRYLRVLDFFERDVDYHSLEYLKAETYEILKQYEINHEELYISIAGSIGYAGVCKPLSNQRIILTENAARIIISNGVDSTFLALQINSEICRKQIHKEIGTGGGVPKLALHRIERLKVVKPSLKEQNQIVEHAILINKSFNSEKDYLSKLELLKNGLMQDLLTGKVRVNTDKEEQRHEDIDHS